MKKFHVVKLTFLFSIVVAFAAWEFITESLPLKIFQPTTYPVIPLLLSKIQKTSIDKETKKMEEKRVGTSQLKMSHLLAQTITQLSRLPSWADELTGPIAGQLARMPTGFAPVCVDHFFITPDNQGGLYVIGEWKANILSSPGGLMTYSLIHYKANGTNYNILNLDKPAGIFNFILSGMGLDGKNNLYLASINCLKKSRSELPVSVVRIANFPHDTKLQPFVGTTSDFAINLLDFCSEIPELCKGEKIGFSHLNHLSVDAKDNLYLGFNWPNPHPQLDGYFQVTLVKIEPSEKVVRVGNFPMFSIDPKTNRRIAQGTISDLDHQPVIGKIEFSLAVDQFDNIFIHSENVLFQFESTSSGYGPVKVVQTMNSTAKTRSIAASPGGSMASLDRQEQAVWQMSPNFDWKLLLGLPHDLDYQLGTGQQTRLKRAEEIVYDQAGRLFIFDGGNDAIIVYK
jgi:hypothetical protein